MGGASVDEGELERTHSYFARLGLTFCMDQQTGGEVARELWGLEFEGRSYRILSQFERLSPDGFAHKWERMLRELFCQRKCVELIVSTFVDGSDDVRENIGGWIETRTREGKTPASGADPAKLSKWPWRGFDGSEPKWLRVDAKLRGMRERAKCQPAATLLKSVTSEFVGLNPFEQTFTWPPFKGLFGGRRSVG